jgi:multimeric flavodoxin WrbA
MDYVTSVNIGGEVQILVMNGNPDPAHRAWEEYLEAFARALGRAGAGVRTRALREMDIHYCTGCWSCWWRTPGLCSFADDMTGVYPEMVGADIVVWASPLVMGNVTALTKKAQDRFIPLLHPYIELVNGESHHRRRYPRNIDLGLIIEPGAEDTPDDAEIVRHMHERLALNGRGRLGSSPPRPAGPRRLPMKRLALNGSPRGSQSNSRRILSWILDGMREAGAEAPPVLDIARTKQLESQREAFLEADEVLLVFPLYTDSVPGVVMGFLNSLAGADRARLSGKRFCFVVHSGFPESAQSEPVAAYLARLCSRLGMRLVGVAIKGGSEGLRIMPDGMTKRTRERFAAIGRGLVRDGVFDPEAVRTLARPRRINLVGRILLTLIAPTNLQNFYWNMQLRKHGAWGHRFDRPYAKETA